MKVELKHNIHIGNIDNGEYFLYNNHLYRKIMIVRNCCGETEVKVTTELKEEALIRIINDVVRLVEIIN